MAGKLKLEVLGRVGQDPETRTLDSGSKVTKFNVATSEKYKNKAGDTVENTTWTTVEAWDKTGEVLAKYVKKGDEILIEGTPSARAYTDKEGSLKAVLTVRVKDFCFVGGKNKDIQSAEPTQTAPAASSGDDSENLPF